MTDLTSSEVHSRTLTAFFDRREAADHAVADLVAAGIPREHVTVTGGDHAAAGTGTTDDRGFWDSLKDMFLPDEDRTVYAEGLRRGGYMLSVRADEANYARVLDILDRDGAVDLDQRESTWRSEGWTGAPVGMALTTAATSAAATTSAATSTAATLATAPSATTSTGAQPARTASSAAATSVVAGRDEVVPVYDEQMRVGKRDVNQGRVRVRSYVVETPVSEQVSLHSERVDIERKPIDRVVAAGDAVFQDRVIEAEEHTEEAVIAKETRLKEEVSLRLSGEDRQQTVTDSVRHTEVEVQDERHAGTAATGKTGLVSEAATSTIAEHMDVIASDGTKIGTVDHLDGPDRIKLAKNTAPDGQHHYVPLAWVDHVDAHVHLNKTSAEAKSGW